MLLGVCWTGDMAFWDSPCEIMKIANSRVDVQKVAEAVWFIRQEDVLQRWGFAFKTCRSIYGIFQIIYIT